MKNINMKVWQCIVCWVLVIFFACSCGTRKVQLEKEKEVLKSKVDSLSSEISKLKSKKTVKKNKVVKNDVKTKNQDIKLTPSDLTKPIELVDSEGNKTSVFNAVIDVKTNESHDKTETKETKEKTEEKDSEVVKTADIVKEIIQEKEIKKKTTESKKSWLNYLPFGIFFVLLALLFYYRKKIPFIRNLFI